MFNPPANSIGVFAQLVLDCQAALQTLPDIDPRYVFIGHYDFLVSQEFYNKLPRAKWEIFIGSPKGVANNYTLEGECQSTMELFFTIPADVPSDLIPIMTKISQINVALSTANIRWVSGGNRNPIKVEWSDIHIRRHEKPFVVSVTFTLHLPYIVDQCSDPFLVPPVANN